MRSMRSRDSGTGSTASIRRCAFSISGDGASIVAQALHGGGSSGSLPVISAVMRRKSFRAWCSRVYTVASGICSSSAISFAAVAFDLEQHERGAAHGRHLAEHALHEPLRFQALERIGR